MNWRRLLRAVAAAALITLFYSEAARTDEAAYQDVVAALENVSPGWHP